VREMLMSEDRCHEVNDGVDIGRHFTECPNDRYDDPAALAIGLQLELERPFCTCRCVEVCVKPAGAREVLAACFSGPTLDC
jgi:hypothetical protein